MKNIHIKDLKNQRNLRGIGIDLEKYISSEFCLLKFFINKIDEDIFKEIDINTIFSKTISNTEKLKDNIKESLKELNIEINQNSNSENKKIFYQLLNGEENYPYCNMNGVTSKSGNCFYLNVIQVTNLNNGFYSIPMFAEIKREDVMCQFIYNKFIPYYEKNLIFNYEELLDFLATNDFIELNENEIEEMAKDIVDEFKEKTTFYNFFGCDPIVENEKFEEYEILSYEVKDLSNLGNDLELRKQELERKEKGETNENL